MLVLARRYGIGDGIVHMNEQLQNNEHIQQTMSSIRVCFRGALTLMTDGDVPLESEKWTLLDTNF